MRPSKRLQKNVAPATKSTTEVVAAIDHQRETIDAGLDREPTELLEKRMTAVSEIVQWKNRNRQQFWMNLGKKLLF